MRDARSFRRRTALLPLVCALLLSGAAPAPPPETEESWDLLPGWAAAEPEREGTLETLAYVSHTGGGTDALAGVYLPPDYDPESRYDAVILWPGTAGDQEDVFLSAWDLAAAEGETLSLTGKELLDRMIAGGGVRPFVLVCMAEITRNDVKAAQRDVEDMLRRLPEEYAVYGPGDDLPPEELREHYAFVGFSQGSIYAEAVGMAREFDRFAWFAAISFGSRWSFIPEVVKASPRELGLLYTLTGDETDYGAALAVRAHEIITGGSGGKIREGENALLRQTDRYGHGYELLALGLWDFLPRAFPAEAE